MRFLVLQPAFLGDVILGLSVPQKLKRFYPQAEVHYLIRKGFENVTANHPAIDQLWLFDRHKSKIKELYRVIKCLRQYDFDVVINLHRFFSSGLITAFLKAKEKVGYDKNPFSGTFDKVIQHTFSMPDAPRPTHEVERYLQLITHLTDDSFERPRLYPSPQDFQKISSYAIPKPYVVIAPASLWATKRLPIEKWQELIEKIKYRFTICLIGGKEDYMPAQNLVNNSDRIFNFCGELSLMQSAAMIAHAHHIFTNDSAPMHLASAVNTPTTAVFCSTIPAFGFGPLAEVSRIVEYRERLPCRPCGLHGHQKCPQGHFQCGKGIEISDLLASLTD
jgi:heptosyltransferase-2